LCWEETSIKRLDSSKPTSIVSSPASSEYGAIDKEIKVLTHDLKDNKKVVRLELFPRLKRANSTLPSSDGDLLAVFEDGSFTCFSSDLQIERWKHDGNRSEPASSLVVFSVLISIALARKTTLKSRTDVLGYDNAPSDLILLTIQTTAENDKASIAKCYNLSPSAVSAHTRLLLSVPLSLPSESKQGWTTSKLSYHTSSGTLHVMSGTCLSSYDLTLTIPKLLYSLELPSASDASNDSIIKISSTNVLVSTDKSIDLFNTKYKSIHASLTLSNSALDRQADKSVKLLSYLQDIDLVVGYDDENIVGIQITKTGSFTGTTLLDSLCKGIKSVNLGNNKDQTMLQSSALSSNSKNSRKGGSDSLQLKMTPSLSEREASEAINTLQSLAVSKDSRAFEKTFAEFVGLDLDTLQTNKQFPEFLYPENIDEVPLRNLPQPFISSVLGSIFTATTTDSKETNSLHISIQAPNVLKFLLIEGLFSCTNLPSQGDGLVEALARDDPELGTLHLVLELAGNHALPLKELVRAVQLVLEQLVDTPATDNSNESNPAQQDRLMTNGTDEDEELLSAASDAERAISEAQHMIDLNDTKEQILRAALEKMNRFPRSAVVQALRENLGGAEQASLIRILRRELIRDGEERAFGNNNNTLDVNGSLSEDMQEDAGWLGIDEAEEEWLGLICDILSCALDAAGITGLLLAKDSLLPPAQLKTGINNQTTAASSSTATVKSVQATEKQQQQDVDDDDEQLLLTSLCSEVQSASQALEEVSTMSILLSDLLNRAVALQASAQQRQIQQQKYNYSNNNNNTSLMSAAAANTNTKTTRMSELEERRRAVLPLGYPQSNTLLTQKSDKMGGNKNGKKRKESKQEMAKKIRSERVKSSMMLGPYTLEKWYV